MSVVFCARGMVLARLRGPVPRITMLLAASLIAQSVYAQEEVVTLAPVTTTADQHLTLDKR